MATTSELKEAVEEASGRQTDWEEAVKEVTTVAMKAWKRTVTSCAKETVARTTWQHKPVEQGNRGWRLAILSVAVCLTTCANVCAFGSRRY